MIIDLENLKEELSGEIHWDSIHKTIYSTDASVYKEEPLAVAYPASEKDLKILLKFAKSHNTSLVPRTAGTSLAGQVVGNGIIIDFSRHFNKIIELNKEEKWVWVEPGVILDELNLHLKQFGLFFGPETSTGNRCMIGGMMGNNACGLHSLVYGTTRDHTIAIDSILSDGSSATFKELNETELKDKTDLDNLEGKIYREISSILSDPKNQHEIREAYPDPVIKRRNTGYALDILLDSLKSMDKINSINISNLLCGSEGTLVLATKLKLNLLPLPPKEMALICAHFNSLDESLKANLIALKNNPTAVELMDSEILDCALSNRAQKDNSFFIDGNPETILIIEQLADTITELDRKVKKTIESIKDAGFGYSFPVVYGEDCSKVWNLRRAGLGLLANKPGDAKSVSVIEDTAVSAEKLPEYIRDVQALFKRLNMSVVYHAHIGTGELHMRPLLNLKDPVDVKRFKLVATEIVSLVKKYRGSLSGEHGDGRLRASFIPEILGKHNYGLLKQVKRAFDPHNILNPGKIVDAPAMNEYLRYTAGHNTPEIKTIYDFSGELGFVRSIEKCNGSGDCRKSHLIGGTMCPSYHASLDERNTTRARANVLREFINKSPNPNKFDHREIYDILDLCLSCKACKRECPSSVDMAKLKGEFLQHWYDNHGVPLRAKIIGNITSLNKTASYLPALSNKVLRNKTLSNIVKRAAGFAIDRSLPEIARVPLDKWANQNILRINPSSEDAISEVCLFIDEFTNYNDSEIGIKAIKLLTALGYKVIITPFSQSGRAYISKGLLKKAREIAISNVELFSGIIDDKIPLIGIEPSAILSFRDEYPDLVPDTMKDECKKLADNTFMIDEFLILQIEAGNIVSESFTLTEAHIKLHGHCQQKAIASTNPTISLLCFPENYTVEEIPSGCCGMAGSFGYEKEHYELSMKVGELVLFPEVRKTPEEEIICAYGTSCRHQIKDGTGRKSYHPVEIMYDALKK